MVQSRVRFHAALGVTTVLTLFVMADVGHAQSYGECSRLTPRGFGVSVGRSGAHLPLDQAAVEAGERAYTSVRSGLQLGGRIDLPVVEGVRARVEASTANWRVERRTYDEDFEPIATDAVGHVDARQVVALIGAQRGRSPLCGYVLIGGGLHSLGYRGASIRRPGFAFTGGIEVPTGDRGAIQFDAQVHIIRRDGRYPVAISDVAAGSITVSWSRRF